MPPDREVVEVERRLLSTLFQPATTPDDIEARFVELDRLQDHIERA